MYNPDLDSDPLIIDSRLRDDPTNLSTVEPTTESALPNPVPVQPVLVRICFFIKFIFTFNFVHYVAY